MKRVIEGEWRERQVQEIPQCTTFRDKMIMIIIMKECRHDTSLLYIVVCIAINLIFFFVFIYLLPF